MTTITDIQERLKIARKLIDPQPHDPALADWYIADVTFLLNELQAAIDRRVSELGPVRRPLV